MLSSGSLNCSGDLEVGLAVESSGTFNQTGGTCTIGTPGSPQELDIGYGGASTGTYLLSGTSTLNISGNLDIGGAGGVAGGPGTFTQSNGTALVSESTFLFPNGTLNQTGGLFDTGTFNQSGGHATVTGLLLDTAGNYTDGTNAHSYTLSGGTLTVSGYEDLGYQSTVTFTQTGGTATVANDLDIADQNTATATYNLSGTGSLSVSGSVFVGGSGDGQGGTGTLAISGGQLTTTGALDIYTHGTLSQTAGSLTVMGGLTNNGTATFSGGSTSLGSIAGTGTLNIGTASSNNTVQLTAQSTPNSFTNTQVAVTIAAGGKLDITNNTLNIDYGSGTSPLAAVANAVAYGAGISSATNANGSIISSTAIAGPAGKYTIGYASHTENSNVPTGNVAIMYTLAGDTNLDGTVNFNDFSILQNNYNKTGQDWSDGDFNHDGTVNFNDFSMLQNNYNQSVNAASPLVRGASKTRATSAAGASPAIVHSAVSPNVVPAGPTVTYILSINDNGSGQFAAGKYAVYVSDSTSDGNTGLASYNFALANTTTLTNFSPAGKYDDGTGNSSDDSIGFTTLRSGNNTSPVTGSQDTIDYPSGVILAYGMGQTAGNLANDEAPGSTGKDGGTTQAAYGAPLEIAKGSFSGLAPSFTNTANDTANDFLNSSSASTEAATLDFSTNTLSTPEPGMLSVLGLGGLAMMRRRRRPRLRAS
jgi:MYXO-CTERM domain-containing protein